MAKSTLTARQMLAVNVSERVMSVLSILGSSFIMFTFIRWHFFRKPINRLVFFAAFGNILTNIATLMATSAIPEAPVTWTPLCEFQGILIQWFMMADSLWVFCMALNVMLVFFWGYNSLQLRRLEKWYALFSYGIPSVPALTYIIIDHTSSKKIIGSATIWCWVSKKAEWMRIAFFYGPVWVVIVLTLSIYVVTGHKIFKKRAALRSFSRHTPSDTFPVINPFTACNLNNIERKTDIHIITETIDSEATVVPQAYGGESRSSFASTRNLSTPPIQIPPRIASPSSPRFARVNWGSGARGIDDIEQIQDDNPASGYKVTVTADHSPLDIEAANARTMSVGQNTAQVRRTAAMDGNTAAWGYFKVAFLMFTALLIVWVPSTINRLQQFADEGHPIFGLNLASALVLPLQGFWNAMVYISTTWPECKRAMAEVLRVSSRSKHSDNRPHLHGNESERTVTSTCDYEFEGNAEVPLTVMLKQGPPSSRRHSQVSSTETMKTPPPGLIH
ncbi:family A G protein-coupled receptor-like protein [Lojkania enalia]|uniref:Family A G protein-coupled receptor-like protein n=1 Tax=Lojkania enalia TaxID=147567 RepID=A0A9P4ND61_9PLEO|nr:family A G protein-coupled receptor-like protein [Didymosphaeria enalia]